MVLIMLDNRGSMPLRKNNRSNSSASRQPRSCAVQKPYPEIKVEGPNTYYACLLLEDYAGQVSELTAITQYVYHHLRLENDYREVADLEECIALVEMEHLEMLGEMIILLGGDPKFTSCPAPNIKNWWCADNVYYGKSVCDMLSADIDAERSAIENYNRHIRMIDDKYVKALLTRIVEDEMEHLRRFQEIMPKYCSK